MTEPWIPSIPPDLAEQEVRRTCEALSFTGLMPSGRIVWSSLVTSGARYRGLVGLRLTDVLSMSECRSIADDILNHHSTASDEPLWVQNLVVTERSSLPDGDIDLRSEVEERIDWNGLWETPTAQALSPESAEFLRDTVILWVTASVRAVMIAETVLEYVAYNYRLPVVHLRSGRSVPPSLGDRWDPEKLEAVSFFVAAFCGVRPEHFYASVTREYSAILNEVASHMLSEMTDCDCCGTRTHAWSVTELDDGSGADYCQPCISDRAFCCTSCEGMYPDSDWNEAPSNDGICPSCYSRNVVGCSECGADRWVDEDCDRCGRIYNSDHDGDGDYGPLPVQYYSYKPEPMFHYTADGGVGSQYWPAETGRTQDDGIFFGVELETNVTGTYTDRAEGGRILFESSLFAGNGFLYAKSDCSVSGPELVSHPATLAAHRALWGDFPFRELVEKNWSGWRGRNAGIHVHIDRRAFRDRAHLARFQIYFGEWRDELTSFAGRNCASYGSHGDYMVGAYRAVRYATGRACPPRGSAINYENSGTIEVRMFRSSLRYTTVMAYLEFLHGLIHYAREKGSHHILSEGGLRFSTFAEWLSDINGNTYDNALTRITERVTL